jgi:hypothetical protein
VDIKKKQANVDLESDMDDDKLKKVVTEAG